MRWTVGAVLLAALCILLTACRSAPASSSAPAEDSPTPTVDDDASPQANYCTTTTGPDGASALAFGNGLIEIDFRRADGAVVQVKDLRRNPPLRLLGALAAGQAPPYEIYEIVKDSPDSRFWQPALIAAPTTTPQVVCDGPTARLTWSPGGNHPTIVATWTLGAGEPEVEAHVSATNLGSRLIFNLRYPILPQIAELSAEDPGDVLLMPIEGGVQISRPLQRLAEEVADGGGTLQMEHYPMGHQAMAQLEALMHAGVGGMLLYTADGGFGNKAFEFASRPPAGRDGTTRIPAWQVLHWNPDIQAASFTPDYPVVLRWLDRGTWDEAAEVYRAWSDQQPWASQPAAQRAAGERQFFEQVGASVFGVSARVDQRPWVEGFRQALVDGVNGAQLLFVFGWDFHPLGQPTEPTTYMAMQQAGRDAAFWSPLIGASQANIDQAQQQGDLAALFYYDILIDGRTPGWDDFTPGEYGRCLAWNEEGMPGGFVYRDVINNGVVYTVDPADPFVADFWKWRDRLIVAQSDPPVDALYFDLGFAITLYGDYDALVGLDRGHPSGAGGWQQQAVRNILDDTRGMANPRGYRYGAENLTEPYVDLVDFWHLGAAGLGPLTDKVSNSEPAQFTSPGSWIMNGLATPTPLMAYLDHHLGALRTGGKMQVSDETGEVFYWNVIAEYLWGGVVELIYYNAPMEWLPTLDAAQACAGLSAERCGFQTGWGAVEGSPRGWYTDDAVRTADPAKLAFLKNAIRLRVASPASPYLTLGRMEAPPAFDPEPPRYSFSYSFYSSLGGPQYDHSGTWNAPPLRAVAWRHPTANNVALLAGNASSLTISTTLTVDLGRYGLAGGAVAEVNLGDGSATAAWRADPKRSGVVNIPVSFAPHSVKMWEITPP